MGKSDMPTGQEAPAQRPAPDAPQPPGADVARDQLAARIGELEKKLKRELEITAHLRASLAKAKAEAAAYRSSSSWKMTWPLRWLAKQLDRPARPRPIARVEVVLEDPADLRPILVAERGALAEEGAPWLGVTIHAFHPELLAELVDPLAAADCAVRLYVTAPLEAVEACREILNDRPHPFKLIQTANRGRDIAPFLEAMKLAIDDGAQVILKLHTKRSPQLKNGAAWRKELLEELVAPGTPARMLKAFQDDATLGIVGPTGHILSVYDYLDNNAQAVRELNRRLGLPDLGAKPAGFVAGSMFYASAKTLTALRALELAAEDFEPETGQLDGTLAHAVERMTGILAISAGQRMSASDDPSVEPLVLAAGAYRFV